MLEVFLAALGKVAGPVISGTRSLFTFWRHLTRKQRIAKCAEMWESGMKIGLYVPSRQANDQTLNEWKKKRDEWTDGTRKMLAGFTIQAKIKFDDETTVIKELFMNAHPTIRIPLQEFHAKLKNLEHIRERPDVYL